MARLTLPALARFPGGRAFAALSRRVRAMIVAGVLFLVLFILTLTLPVPYVILKPGPTCNTLGAADGPNCVGGSDQQIIVLKGATARKTDGNLNLTTVSESGDSVTALQAFLGWLHGDETVVPYASIHPPGSSEQQDEQQNAADFSQSQDNAIVAASCELNYPKRFGVVGVEYTGPSHGKLVPGDVLTSVDGKQVSSVASLRDALTRTQPEQRVTLSVVRAGTSKDVAITLGSTIKGRTGGSLGVVPGTVCALPFAVDLGLGNQIGGPSAGLMFALGIMDKVGKTDLTHGRFIAGTGTITAAGKVGPIGGIQLKMIAARRAGASVFLAPAGNCDEVRGNIPSGLTVIRVSSLHGAVTDLQRTAAGQTVTGC